MDEHTSSAMSERLFGQAVAGAMNTGFWTIYRLGMPT